MLTLKTTIHCNPPILRITLVLKDVLLSINITIKPSIMDDITFLEEQLLNKRIEYLQAIERGDIHDELKKIYLEFKSLREKLIAAKQSISLTEDSVQ